MKKKWIVILTALLATAALSVACSGGGKPSDDKTTPDSGDAADAVFTVNEGTITGLTEEGKLLTSLVIPSAIGGVPITGIGEQAFFKLTGLHDAVIPNGVTNIGEKAFQGCTGLRDITLGNGVTRIGESAFLGCAALTSVTLPAALTGIGMFAFSDCTGLTDIAIPNGVTSLGHFAFYGCTGLRDITIPDSVISIGNAAFSETAWLEAQPNGLVYAGRVAYTYKGTMPADTSLTLQPGTKGIAVTAFQRCAGLIGITLGDDVTHIGDGAFLECKGLTSIVLGSAVTRIGYQSFAECTGLAVINYKGTQAQWNGVVKDDAWNLNCPATIVYSYAG
jgi:hypothetical protein